MFVFKIDKVLFHWTSLYPRRGTQDSCQNFNTKKTWRGQGEIFTQTEEEETSYQVVRSEQ